MPFESNAQRKFMYANYPKIAKRWSKHTPKGKKLPEYVKEDSDVLNSLDMSKAGNLTYKATSFPNKTEARVAYGVDGDVDKINVQLFYTVGRTPEEIEYKDKCVVRDLNDTQSSGIVIEGDPLDSEDLLAFIKARQSKKHKLDLSPEDIVMAVEDGYDKIKEELFGTSDMKAPYEESLQFEALFNKIIES